VTMNALAPSSQPSRAVWQFQWKVMRGRDAAADPVLLRNCSTLFSAHYGYWSDQTSQRGERVRISSDRVQRLVDNEDAWLVCGYHEGDLIGYVIALTFDFASHGRVAWVTQLVVHETYRNSRLATTLLRSIWEFSDYYAWGLVTANPLAVRALEAASRRSVRTSLVRSHGPDLVTELSKRIDYIPSLLCRDKKGKLTPVVDTRFMVSHTELPVMRKQAARSDRPWPFGNLEEGQEWFACTFGNQDAFQPTADQWEALLRSSEHAWVEAYERMALDRGHRWHAHEDHEAGWIRARVKWADDAEILDLGCGDGRHVRALARLGLSATGIDIAPTLIEKAKRTNPEGRYYVRDARHRTGTRQYDGVLCLYDVLGSSPDPKDDELILKNIVAVIRPGGSVILSVMNATAVTSALTEWQRPDSYPAFVSALDQLRPSRTMQDTGDIHNPDLLVLFDGTFYRKEQFLSAGDKLPREVVVRDRRFSIQALCDLLQKAGFIDISVIPVQAGAWNRDPPLAETDPRAKELLAVCTRS